jgi:hypothetical protein
MAVTRIRTTSCSSAPGAVGLGRGRHHTTPHTLAQGQGPKARRDKSQPSSARASLHRAHAHNHCLHCAPTSHTAHHCALHKHSHTTSERAIQFSPWSCVLRGRGAITPGASSERVLLDGPAPRALRIHAQPAPAMAVSTVASAPAARVTSTTSPAAPAPRP